MKEEVKIAVVGAGGVGGYYGGLLARAGLNVSFLCRGAHLEAIMKRGLTVESYRGDFRVDVQATDDPAEIGVSDVVLFCVKSYDTEDAARMIRPMVGPATVVVSLQNGVDNEEVLGKILGKEKIMGGVAFIGSRIREPGVILHTAAGGMTLGEMSGGMSERGKMLVRLFESAGIEARLSEDIRKVMWRKMVWNCGFNALTALTGCTVGEVLALGEARAVIRAAMEEVIAVARALGIGLAGDLPEKTMSHTEKQGEIRTSMLMDNENGRRMEIEALNGAVSRRGRENGVPTPVNDVFYAAVKAVNVRRGFL